MAAQQNLQTAVETYGPAIVYQLPILVNKLDGPLLVVGYGSPMKATVKAAVKCGCTQVWVTGTEDKARAFSCSGTAHVVPLGSKFDARLFSNEYAIMEAARKCDASVMLVVNPETANSSLLRMVANQAGIKVLGPMG